MNLYEFEGKKLFHKYTLQIPNGITVQSVADFYLQLSQITMYPVVVKAQVLTGKRGKNNGIIFCNTLDETRIAVEKLLGQDILGKPVTAVRIEQKANITHEHYISITYDTRRAQPICVYSADGGVDIESVAVDKIQKTFLDIRNKKLPATAVPEKLYETAQKLWDCFLGEDTRLVEINPLVETEDGKIIALDAKVILDDDAFFRHEDWKNYSARTMMGRPPTRREQAVIAIDAGENYYRGTAGKYVEMDGNIAILFSGGGASIANMDALIAAGGTPANYTEYSGNPPREKVYALAKIVLSKPNLQGLWIAGGVANFTNVKETFQGIVDALDEIKPAYPIVIRRAGPYEAKGKQLMEDCAARNNLKIKYFGKETSMTKTAQVLMDMINKK